MSQMETSDPKNNPGISDPQSQSSGVPSSFKLVTLRGNQKLQIRTYHIFRVESATITPIVPVPAPVDVGPGIVIQNMVGTISVGCPLDLNQINSRVRYSEYNPGKFHGLIMKILQPRATCLTFQSGKLLVVGAKHEQDCKLASRKFAKIIQQIGYPVKYQGFKIHNIVCTCDVRFPVKLEALHHLHSQFSSYEPELFPGLIYRMVKPRVVLLIFVNGRIVITGAKSRAELHEAFDNIYPVLKSFKKQ